MAIGTMTLTSDLVKAASAPSGIAEVSFVGDTSYPTGGTAAFNATVQALMGRAVTVLGIQKSGPTGVYTPIYDKVNDKLYVEVAAGTEVPNATDLHGTTFKLLVFYA
jgi:hypothetical protein